MPTQPPDQLEYAISKQKVLVVSTVIRILWGRDEAHILLMVIYFYHQES